MTALLAGKLTYSTLPAFAQLVLMFVWAWAVFKLDLLSHIPGFVVMVWPPLAPGGGTARGGGGAVRHRAPDDGDAGSTPDRVTK